MRFKLICCEVFVREACLAVNGSLHTINPEFTPKGAHEDSDKLRDLIQSKIDEADASGIYDYILLGFGLCGNALAGIKAGIIPLVIPRAHDCCTIFLGSREKFMQHFGDNPSQEWSCTGYMERGGSYLREGDIGKQLGIAKTFEELVNEYGEENAGFIWETLHPKKEHNELIFIDTPETSGIGYLERFKELADQAGSSVKVLQGDMRLLRRLIKGDWDTSEYLVVPPGETIQAVYDFDEIIRF